MFPFLKLLIRFEREENTNSMERLHHAWKLEDTRQRHEWKRLGETERTERCSERRKGRRRMKNRRRRSKRGVGRKQGRKKEDKKGDREV